MKTKEVGGKNEYSEKHHVCKTYFAGT